MEIMVCLLEINRNSMLAILIDVVKANVDNLKLPSIHGIVVCGLGKNTNQILDFLQTMQCRTLFVSEKFREFRTPIESGI